jgi:hypothetical protein
MNSEYLYEEVRPYLSKLRNPHVYIFVPQPSCVTKYLILNIAVLLVYIYFLSQMQLAADHNGRAV